MKRVLFVDDEVKILDGIRRMLYPMRSQWEMKFAVGGEAALKECEAGSFDVVVSDMRMPGMDGATLLGIIRDRYPSSARMILSGYSEASLARRAVPVAHRFLAKPCNAVELQSNIENVCALQDLMCSEQIRKVVGSIGELPSLSKTYLRLTDAVNDPEATIQQIAEIIEEDIAMSAKVLQLINSAFFGLAQKVTSLSAAVSYLGIEVIKHLALASEAFRVLTPNASIPHSVLEAMQLHAKRTSAVAAVLPIEKKIREMVVVTVLLHDIGELFLASAMPTEFCSVLALAKERGSKTFEAEEEIFGISHAEIGAYLLGLWGFPNLAIEGIAHHHHPTRIQHADLDCTLAIYVSDFLAHEMEAARGATKPIEISESDRATLETLGVLPQLDVFRELAREANA